MADWYKASLVAIKSTSADDSQQHDEIPFRARRSPVFCRHGCVASSQPLASEIGVHLLRQGANAADAAIAVAATLAVTEPCSTGLGGDMFCLYYDAATKSVSSINGSGKSPAQFTLSLLKIEFPSPENTASSGVDEMKFRDSPHAITVPGAARGWQDLYDRYASKKVKFADLLEPAAKLAEEGFPVAPITSYHWKAGHSQLAKWCDDDANIPLTVDGKRAPEPGEIMVNPDLARVLRELGDKGADEGFYQGLTGKAIANVIQKHGGCMTVEDLEQHTSDFPEAISAQYRDYKLWQIPPNGQGIAGLIALSGLDHLEQKQLLQAPLSPDTVATADQYHAMIEMMRLGFADARAHVADPTSMKVTSANLLDPDRIGQRAARLFNPEQAVIQGTPDASSCTVSFQVVDQQGNAISFVNSNFMGFGTGMVPDGCGFTLQNRGFGFTLQEGHPNAPGPSKRPYHTIIPGMLTHADTNELYASISNMGGNMQPQGHLQLTVGLIANQLDPQTVVDLPRFCMADGTQDGVVYLEQGIDEKEIKKLQVFGHKMKPDLYGHERSIFGRAQIITRNRQTGVLCAGSDGRADGCAIGF